MSAKSVWGWLGGRSGRGEYWLSILGLVVLNVVLHFGLGDPFLVSLVSTPFWLVIAARRLHDFNQTGWLGLIPFGVGFVIGLAVGAGVYIPLVTVMLANSLTALIVTVVIGSIPGTPGANRFGVRERRGG